MSSLSRELTKEEVMQHKKQALSKMEDFLNTLITSDKSWQKGKADKLSYWLEDWVNFLSFEEQFSALSLRRYKRGEIIKVHLGFNVGSEEGGLHYAVVLDKNNAKSSPVITIIPLTSAKPNVDVNNLKGGSIFLGNELFASLNAKVSATNRRLVEELELLQKIVDKMDYNTSPSEKLDVQQRIDNAREDLNFLNRMRNEVLRMKKGSIALVNQITTISKIRIYDPKTDHDILSGIKLSNEKLDLIDEEIRKRFTKV